MVSTATECGCGCHGKPAKGTTYVRGHYKVVVYVRHRLKSAQANAKRLGVPFTLTLDQVWAALVEENGTELKVHKNRTLERKIKTLGFTKENLLVKTKQANTQEA